MGDEAGGGNQSAGYQETFRHDRWERGGKKRVTGNNSECVLKKESVTQK